MIDAIDCSSTDLILVHSSSKWQVERQLELRLVSHVPWSLAPRPMHDEKLHNIKRGLQYFALHSLRFAL